MISIRPSAACVHDASVYEIVVDRTGEILLTGTLPVDKDAVDKVCAAYYRRSFADTHPGIKKVRERLLAGDCIPPEEIQDGYVCEAELEASGEWTRAPAHDFHLLGWLKTGSRRHKTAIELCQERVGRAFGELSGARAARDACDDMVVAAERKLETANAELAALRGKS